MLTKWKIQNAWKHLLLIVIGFIMLYPVLWMLSSSFKPNEMIFNEVGLWPRQWTLDNYISGLAGVRDNPFYRYIINSLIVCLAAVAGSVLSTSMAAYAFGRLDFRFKNIAFAIMLATIILPVHVKLIPQYIMFNSLKWVGTFLPVIAPKWFAVEGFFIFLIVQFIRGLPRELDEAATVDGCKELQIYLRIIMPLTVPALVTTAIYTFLWTWDDFLSQLIYFSKMELYTVPLGLRLFLDSTSQSNYGAMFAMSVVSLLPCFVIFITCQKYFVEGISTTGIKG
jgi:multiple sugar transport system permease protein